MSVAGLEGASLAWVGFKVVWLLEASVTGLGCLLDLDVLLTQGYLSEDDLDLLRPSVGADFERAFRPDVAFLADVQAIASRRGDCDASFSMSIGLDARQRFAVEVDLNESVRYRLILFIENGEIDGD